jgi:hypothetical protein
MGRWDHGKVPCEGTLPKVDVPRPPPPTYVGGQRPHVRWGGGTYVRAERPNVRWGGGDLRRKVNVVIVALRRSRTHAPTSSRRPTGAAVVQAR